MARIRDVWVNWFEGEENGYNVCPFHEWRSEDHIEVLDYAEIVRVTPSLLNYIEDRLEELPDSLMSSVYQKTTLRKNMKKITLDYCFIATDGENVLAVDTAGYHTPIKKSRLTPRQEELVLEKIKHDVCTPFELGFTPSPKSYHILSPPPAHMAGLTRKERALKQLLYMAIDELNTSKNRAKLKYWFTEWSPEDYPWLDALTGEEIWNRLYREISEGWTTRHYNLCRCLVKGQPFFEKLWSLEHKDTVKENGI
ncbi:DUF3603 family protein [Salsuginibacillus kocurii]|uniref:DUF3603 family protein n=1 Tax=Salsuginibacillus kocurii TaxID=427078 RepID=UPI00037F0289|nr:DUF3603 family protein [Salsuginibacillus kocurii]